MPSESFLRLGTSAFTANGCAGTFYPKNLKPPDYLAYYAQHFDCVEVDSTFYHAPALTTVQGWYAKTPPGFLFAAKVPQSITHEKVLVDCRDEMGGFLARLAESLRERDVALALVDRAWMPRPRELFEKFDPITADFTYIRWLGDRKGIEERTKTWNRAIVDRREELREWAEVCAHRQAPHSNLRLCQ